MATKTSKTAKTTKAKPGKPTKAVKSTKTTSPAAKATKGGATVVKVRPARPTVSASRHVARPTRITPQYAYMKAPGLEHVFEVGDTVEVFCDHEKNNDRIRGWIKGIVVQVDHKMVAVQFRSNVFLTDGWMVPDRILWYPLTSDQIRATGIKKAGKREFIPDY